MRLRHFGLIAVLGCASVTPAEREDGEATLTRGGGITGLVETIQISSIGGVTQGTYLRSDRQEARQLTLPPRSLDSTLSVIENLAAHAPRPPKDNRTVCADVILIHVESRRGDAVRTAQEECPHQSQDSEKYWQRLNALFRDLAASAAN